MNLCLVAWMADTNPHASELIADVRFGRTQAVMPCSPAAALDLHLIGSKVQLVMKDSDVLRAQLVEAHGFSDGAATFIHEYRRFQQQNFFRAKPPLGDPALKLLLRRRKAMHIRNDIGSHKPDIVPVERILSARHDRKGVVEGKRVSVR